MQEGAPMLVHNNWTLTQIGQSAKHLWWQQMGDIECNKDAGYANLQQ